MTWQWTLGSTADHGRAVNEQQPDPCTRVVPGSARPVGNRDRWPAAPRAEHGESGPLNALSMLDCTRSRAIYGVVATRATPLEMISPEIDAYLAMWQW